MSSSISATTTTTSIAARLEARTSSNVKQENATVASGNYAESSDFLRSFEEEKKAIENELSRVSSEKDGHVKNGTDDAASQEALKLQLATINARLVTLQQSTAAHAHLLTAYDVRSTKLQLTGLEEACARTGEIITPKKRFAFKKKTQPAAQPTATPSTTDASSPTSSSTTAANIVAPATSAIELPPEDPRTGFFRKENLVLIKTAGSITGQDVMLSHLRNCVVFILDRPSALRCHNLVGCHIFIGPCSGSVLIYGSQDCTFHMATRQLRIHDTHRTTFHLFALSNPIIEHSDTSGFSSYDFTYPNLESDLKESGFEGKTSRHATVEDFNWLRTQQSPNWYALTEEQQRTRQPVHLTDAHLKLPFFTNMTDDQSINTKQQAELKQLVSSELKIIV